MKQILVIGGGAAGMMAAYQAAQSGTSVVSGTSDASAVAVTLVERNEKLGRKLYITGKGRCNVTNDCPPEEALKNYPGGSRFLKGALYRFPPEETKQFFTSLGVPLKTERGNRVFPQSDRAADIIDALLRALRRSGVNILHGRVTDLLLEENRVTGVRLENGKTLAADAVIIATGGVSYPATGSTGDGYTLAEQAGHSVVPPRGSLVPLTAAGDECERMMGLSLRNIRLRIRNEKKKVIFDQFGELLFTHFGLSGPLILSASAHLRDERRLRDFDKHRFSAIIDLKPALDEQQLDQRILRDFAENQNRSFGNVLGGLLPRLMIPVMLDRVGIPAQTKVNEITKSQRRRLLEELKNFRLELTGTRPVAEAIVTAGGVKCSEVNPVTMESKKVQNLYFAGEVLDVDGYTGGFNLQAAWATGYAAGRAAAQAAPGGKLPAGQNRNDRGD